MDYDRKTDPWVLNADIVEWLESRNIQYAHYRHTYEEDGKTYIQQRIAIYDDKAAVLYKLTWC